MADNPWDDPSLASDETKKLRQRTKDMRLNPPARTAPPPKPKGISALSDAFGQAETLEKKRKKVEVATRPFRKALPNQGQ